MSETENKNTTYKQVEKLVHELHEHYALIGLSNIYFVACGGSLGGLAPMYAILSGEAKVLGASLITAGEFLNATPKQVNETALVISMSASGNTPETVAAARKAQKRGAKVVTLSELPGTPLEAEGNYHILYGFKDCPYTETSSALLMRFGFELLEQFQQYAHYQEALAGFDILNDVCEKAFTDSAAPARVFAETSRDEEQIYTVGSGTSAMVAYTTCICHLMEMEWINSGYIHAGELFHGPCEVARNDVPYMVLVNAGRTRTLDERAVTFLQKRTERLFVLDAIDYGLDRFAPSVAEYFNMIVLAIVARQYTETLAIEKKHPFGYRRYMFKVEY